MCHSTAANTRPTHAAIIPSATRWSEHTHRDALHRYQNHRHAGRCTDQRSRIPCKPGGVAHTVCGSLASDTHGAPAEGSASPPVQGQPGGVSMFPTSGGLQSGTGSAWHPPPGGSAQQQGAAGGAEPLTACAAALFGLSPDS